MKIVSGFYHTRGNHCGSTAMRDLLRCAGLDLSEAMCFGLGSGLGFHYFRDIPDTGISHFFHGRTGTLERDLCRRLALDLADGLDDDPDHAWRAARAFVDADVPVLLNVELSRLPYYNSRTPFPGHRVVLAGYDDARAIAFLADNAFESLQEISFDALRDARYAPAASSLFPLRNDWLAVKSSRDHPPLADAIQIALRENARVILDDRDPNAGLAGMRTLAADLVNWGNAPDWEFCARFGYQIIERRGTGGGAFRKMYAEYLREAADIVPGLRAARLSDALAEIADAWTAFANLLKRVSDEKDRARFADAGNALRDLATREENFWRRVIELVGEKR
ncbi:MAG: BtrH N-terminal domain-containing protein [Anaerolineales bacterium]|nr:BtrH N-terminal domain-containing protein [Anaerolineales bacterium]